MDFPSIPPASPGVEAFLQPLRVDRGRIHTMAGEFSSVFTHLAAESLDQFLPTPISESILLPFSQKKKNQGRYLAIDIGGTNLRVGFIELLGDDGDDDDSVQHNGQTNGTKPLTNGHRNGFQNGEPLPDETQGVSDESAIPHKRAPKKATLRRLHERNWSIQDHLKSQNADSLFAWIGSCIASVVQVGCLCLGLSREAPLPMGVTFSFPMEQESLSEAKLMSMGKGFAMTAKLDLGSHLITGYNKARLEDKVVLPPITIAAISNDSVSTLVSFVYEVPAVANQKAAMGLICGTGSNATLLLKRSKLHPSKRKATGAPCTDNLDGCIDDEKVAINTEWSINGSAPAMRAVNLISRWDDELSLSVESPGFQPLEYMTSGRYLGELGRIMLLDYMVSVLGVDAASVPAKFLNKFEPRNTMFLSRFRPGESTALFTMLESEFPTCNSNFNWTEEIAEVLYHIAKAIETRAAAIIAAAIVGLLDCADELPPATNQPAEKVNLVVGYTGGCITNFQDYLADCQAFLDVLMAEHYGSLASSPVRIVLSPCHDGGIKGAGILVPASLASQGLLDTV
ncbi:hexokinase family protein [Ophiostoma piceae UAMH 11346]|uniref:Phosphotransferase n=1 Tax=Ophiostoma piceae (strain UAMH 11346) TaxID=1262450 RepID=S3CNT8_OPHP1|nr:hexokinase family protein [Ophiostoma piceae UAMH 11346]